jgi:SAM-dependent methyltransferase
MKTAAKTVVKRALEAVDPLLRWQYRLTSGWDRPIPPMRFRARTAARWVRPFVRSGKNCAAALEDALAQTVGKRIYDFEPVLDFGCGCGRTIMQWKLDELRRLVGCDVDGPAIGWLRGAYAKWAPKLSFEQTRFDPPLPFESGRFELLYSVSIFSHLGREDERQWLPELARVTRPGGIALITTQGPHAWKKANELSARFRQWAQGRDLEKEDFIFIPVPPPRGQKAPPGIESPNRKVEYGLTYMTTRHIESEWGRGPWSLLRVFSGTVDDLQDVVVLRREG